MSQKFQSWTRQKTVYRVCRSQGQRISASSWCRAVPVSYLDGHWPLLIPVAQTTLIWGFRARMDVLGPVGLWPLPIPSVQTTLFWWWSCKGGRSWPPPGRLRLALWGVRILGLTLTHSSTHHNKLAGFIQRLSIITLNPKKKHLSSIYGGALPIFPFWPFPSRISYIVYYRHSRLSIISLPDNNSKYGGALPDF